MHASIILLTYMHIIKIAFYFQVSFEDAISVIWWKDLNPSKIRISCSNLGAKDEDFYICVSFVGWLFQKSLVFLISNFFKSWKNLQNDSYFHSKWWFFFKPEKIIICSACNSNYFCLSLRWITWLMPTAKNWHRCRAQ